MINRILLYFHYCLFLFVLLLRSPLSRPTDLLLPYPQLFRARAARCGAGPARCAAGTGVLQRYPAPRVLRPGRLHNKKPIAACARRAPHNVRTEVTMKRIAALLLALCAIADAHAFDPFTVSEIRPDGLSRIPPGTVFTYLPVQPGAPPTPQPPQQPTPALSPPAYF